MSDWTIKVEAVGKRYVLRHVREVGHYVTLRDTITNHFRRLFDRTSPGTRPREDFWALRDVSFTAREGEVIGIIGRNGAGKSTLLKILSRITAPSSGCVRLRGRVASLLEAGTGFHPELTGRENIFLNGAILGMSHAEIRRKFANIVAFSDVEKFLDTPVKHYSSGMHVRLAFAVAAHLEPEILIVDEVLAVGDLAFQKKCLAKMKDVSGRGRTVLFVSHNMAAIQALCSRVLVLQDGQVSCDTDTPSEAVAVYTAVGHVSQSRWVRSPEDVAAGPLVFRSISVALSGEQPCHQITVSVELQSRKPHPPAILAFDILDSASIVVMQALPSLEPMIPYCSTPQCLEVRIDLPPLIPDSYQLTAWVGPHNTITFDLVSSVVTFSILTSPTPGRSYPHTRDHGHVVPHSVVTVVPTLESSQQALCG